MKRNKSEHRNSPDIINPISGKSFKEENIFSQPIMRIQSYEDLNKKYTIAGFNQYTLQYLKRMSNSGKSNSLPNVSSWVSSF
jgi:hypothetical protein